MNHRFTRLGAAAVIAAGTLTGTLALAAHAATPASADEWHRDGFRDRDDRRPYEYRPRAVWHDHDDYYRGPVVVERGPRYYDRVHGYWRDRLGYWNPRSGFYVSFHF